MAAYLAQGLPESSSSSSAFFFFLEKNKTTVIYKHYILIQFFLPSLTPLVGKGAEAKWTRKCPPPTTQYLSPWTHLASPRPEEWVWLWDLLLNIHQSAVLKQVWTFPSCAWQVTLEFSHLLKLACRKFFKGPVCVTRVWFVGQCLPSGHIVYVAVGVGRQWGGAVGGRGGWAAWQHGTGATEGFFFFKASHVFPASWSLLHCVLHRERICWCFAKRNISSSGLHVNDRIVCVCLYMFTYVDLISVYQRHSQQLSSGNIVRYFDHSLFSVH